LIRIDWLFTIIFITIRFIIWKYCRFLCWSKYFIIYWNLFKTICIKCYFWSWWI